MIRLRLALLAFLAATAVTPAPSRVPQPPAAAPAEPPEPAGKPILVLDAGGHTGTVTAVFFTPDGKQLISCAADKTVRVWDAGTGEPLRVLRLPLVPEDRVGTAG